MLTSYPAPQPHETPASQRIYWLASYPRSGNTWVRSFLHSLMEQLQGRPGSVDINRLQTFSIPEAWVGNFTSFLADPADVNNFTALTALRPQAQERLAAQVRGSVFVATHLAALELDETPAVNTQVTRGATYIVRNPLDVACSLAAHMGWSIDQTIEVMATVGYCFSDKDSVPEPLSSWSHHVESWTRREQAAVHVMRYEDMLAQPVRTFAAFVRHAGLKPTRPQLMKAIDQSQFNRLRRQEEAGGFALSGPAATAPFFRQGRSGGWREILSKDQVDRIVATHQEQMARFGYLEGL
jgi:hypothetical protein